MAVVTSTAASVVAAVSVVAAAFADSDDAGRIQNIESYWFHTSSTCHERLGFARLELASLSKISNGFCDLLMKAFMICFVSFVMKGEG